MSRTTNMGMGWRKDQLDPRDHAFGITHAPHRLPLKMSMRNQMPPVYDQGQLGSCTGNGIAAVMEHRAMQEQEGAIMPSRLYIYYHERVLENTVSEDVGAEIRDGLKVVAKLGVPPESDWPYDISKFAEAPPQQAEQDASKHKATAYARVYPGSGGAPVRSALAHGYPIVFGFSVPQRFEDLSAGHALLEAWTPQDEMVGGHCVAAVGYDFTRTEFPVNVVEVRNSWGPSWGEAGYFYMDASWFNNRQLTSDFWVVHKES